MEKTLRRITTVIEGYVDKKKFTQRCPDLDFLNCLPDVGYFKYNKKTHMVSYHIDCGIVATLHQDSCQHLPRMVKQMLAHLAVMVDKHSKSINYPR